MNEYTVKKLGKLAGGAGFLICMWLVMNGQRTISYSSLLQMVVGLGGILSLLYLYNRSYR